MLNYRTKATELKTIADVLKDVLAECWFVFDTDIITMTNVDPEKVIAVSLYLRPDPTTYQCGRKFIFPFYIQTLYRVLRGVKSSDMAVLSEGNGGCLQIDIMTAFGVLKNQITLQPLKDSFPIFLRQQHHYEVEVRIDSRQFYHILHDLSALSRKVTVKVVHDEVSFLTEDDNGTKSIFTQAFPELDSHFTGTYLLKYLEKFSKPALADEIKIRMSQDTPLSVVYHLERGSLEMSIAPSV